MSSSFRPSHLALAISSALALSSVQAAVVTVDTLADPGEKSNCSLRAAIESVNNQYAVDDCVFTPDGLDDTIEFAAGLEGSIVLTDGELLVTEDVTISGPGADLLTIDAQGNSGVFSISGAAASISDLTITGGIRSFGAGVYVNYADARLSDCVISGNYANSLGGGIEVFYGDLVVERCEITSNSTSGSGGGIAVTTGNATVMDSTISGNEAVSGGGIWLPSRSSGPSPEGASMPRAGGRGGYGNSSLMVVDSLITGNSADYMGGGIAAGYKYDQLLQGSETQVQQAVASRGGAPNLALIGTTITGNTAEIGGGLVLFGSEGGAEELRGGPYNGSTNLAYISDSSISGNQAVIGGGLSSKYSTAYLINSSVDDNVAYFVGGGIVNSGSASNGPVGELANRGGGLFPGMLIAIESTISGNVIDDMGLDANRGIGQTMGGGIAQAYGAAYIIDTEVNDNLSSGIGGGVMSVSGAVIASGSQFSGNTGGGAFIEEGLFAAIASRIEGNSGSNSGGVSCNGSSYCSVKYSSVTDNHGVIAGGIGADLGGVGESASWDGSRGGEGGYFSFVQVSSSTFSGNTGGYFGAIGAPDLQLEHSTIAFNEQLNGARGGGFPHAGGIGTTSDSTLFHSIISNNSSEGGFDNLNVVGGNIATNYSLVGDAQGFIPVGSGNIFNQDPMLGALAFNGSTYSLTHALLPGSPAIDAGDPTLASAPDYDQRGSGFDRVFNDVIDIGAFEFQGDVIPDEPALALSTSEIDFDDILVGSSDFATLTINSTGDADLELGSLTFDGGFRGGASVFSLINDTCSAATLAPTESCTVDVLFEPPARGMFSDVITIPSNTGTSPDTVDILGVGVAPELTIIPPVTDFGIHIVGTTSPVEFVAFSNTGDSVLNIDSLDGPTLPFAIDGGTCNIPESLAIGASCTIGFNFTPLLAGDATEAILVNSDSLGGDEGFTLTGEGSFEPEPPPPGEEDAIPVPVMSRVATFVLGGGLLLLGWMGMRRRQI